MTDRADDVHIMDEDEDADLARAIDAAGPSTPGESPAEEGPRRRVLVVLAAVIGAVLLWMLFRSVPAEPRPASPRDETASGRAAAVEGMANESDPSWMQAADTSRRVGSAPGSVIPPVYGRAGSGAPGYQAAGDSAAAAGAAPGAAVPPADGAPPPRDEANPRREAFLAALRSKPLQGAASLSPEAYPAGDTAAGAIPDPPTLAEMDADALAEAQRRSAPAGGFTADAGAQSALATPPFVDNTPSQASRSSYVTGGSGPRPQVAAPQRLSLLSGTQGSFTIPVGTVIEGQLHTAVNSDLPGSVVGMVTRNVYDATQRAVVIPRYSWLFGTYESDIATGQARLVIQWTAIRFPSGETYELPALRAADPTGASGLRGRVNNHYGRLFGQALLSSVVAAGFNAGGAASNAQGQSARDALAEATAQNLGQAAAEVTRRNLNIKPTITVPRLTRFSIILDRDLTFTSPSRR